MSYNIKDKNKNTGNDARDNDGLLHDGGEWDSPSTTLLHAKVDVAKDGKLVRVDGQLCIGAGAEPLSIRQLSTGHSEFDRPSGILDRLKEEIVGDQSMMTKEEIQVRPIGKG